MNSVSTGHAVAMLQTPRSTHAAPVLQPEALLQSLLSSFRQVSEEQTANEASLRDAFDKQSRLGGQQYVALLGAQAELRAIKAEETLFHDRLSVALTHLEKVHKQLMAQASHLSRFAKHLGDQMPPKLDTH